MTFERPTEVREMILKLKEQSVSPDKILIVDNSASLDTQLLVEDIGDPAIHYFRVGMNSGPAGAAHFGLKILASEGFDWIYWGDDDDPPRNPNDFKILFEVLRRANSSYERIGIVGKAGGKFNKLTGRTSSFRNRELKDGIMEADFVPGNNISIINGSMINEGIQPNQKLFFGFEELDFCLKVKRAGYRIIFDSAAFLERRKSSGRGHPDYKWKGQSIGMHDKLWRQYYSTRNMLNILTVNHLWIALAFNILRNIVKSAYGFRYGLGYGVKNAKIQWLAIIHFAVNRFGKTDLGKITKA